VSASASPSQSAGGLRPVNETRGVNLVHPAFWLIVLAALPLFLLTKNVATAGVVTVDRLEYWFCGLLPLVAYCGLRRLEKSRWTGLKDVFSIGVAAWLLSLVAYLVLQLTFLSETFEFPMQEKFGYSSPISTAMTSGIYVAFGSLFALSPYIRRQKVETGGRLASAAFALALNWVMFFTLVFVI
jgi:hypothetical protein